MIVNAGADEQVEDNKSTNYGKIATAISNMQKRGENITLPLINSMDFGFIPDEEHDRISILLKQSMASEMKWHERLSRTDHILLLKISVNE